MSHEIIKKFNEILESFLVQLKPVIGGKYHRKFTIATKLNSSVAMEKFLVAVLPFREHIIEKNEYYFINNDHSNKIEDKDDLNEIMNLKDIFEKLDNESKENVWAILQALLVLGEDYIRIIKMK
jgi:hypothetical protein